MKKYDRATVGLRIKELREKKGMTQDRFSRVLSSKNVNSTNHKSILASIERGVRGLSIENAFEIANQYNVSLDWIYGFVDTDKNAPVKNLEQIEKYFDFTQHNNTIRINRALVAYLKQLDEVAIVKMTMNGLTQDIIDTLIENIQKKFNDEMQNEKNEMVEYHLVTESEYKTWQEYVRERDGIQ